MMKPVFVLACMFCAVAVQAQPQWKMWGDLHEPRHRSQAVRISPTELMVVGGWADARGGSSFGTRVLSSCEILDGANGTVTMTDDMDTPRAEYGIVVMADGAVVVLGGVIDGTDETTASVERFDPSTRRWTTVGNLLYVRRQHEAVALGATKILVIGGRKPSLDGRAECEIFDLATGTSMETGALPYPLTDFQLVRDHQGRVLCIGGRRSGPQSARFTSVLHFDEITRTWETIMNMPTPNAAPTELTLSNRRVVVSGGSEQESPNVFIDRVYIIGDDEPIGFAGVMQEKKQWHGMGEWTTDSVVSFGGQDNRGAALVSSDWIDLGAKTVSPGPDLNVARKYFLFGSLQNVPQHGNMVFAISGIGKNNDMLTSIEVLEGGASSNPTCDPATSIVNLMGSPAEIGLAGVATMMRDTLRLTDNTEYAAGSAWSRRKLDVVHPFTMSFSFRISGGRDNGQPDAGDEGADGIALLIQNAGPLRLGYPGQGIGYEGIANAVAIEFDSYKNASCSDPSTSHVAVQASKDRPIRPWHREPFLVAMAGDVPPITSGPDVYHARVAFDGSTLKVYLGNMPNLFEPVLTVNNFTFADNLALGADGTAFIGFTSGTGFAVERHDILTWTLQGCADSLMTDVDEGNGGTGDVGAGLDISPLPAGEYTVVGIPVTVDHTSALSIDVVDLSGRTVWSTSAEPFTEAVGISTASLSAGMYWVRIVAGMDVYSTALPVVK